MSQNKNEVVNYFVKIFIDMHVINIVYKATHVLYNALQCV